MAMREVSQPRHRLLDWAKAAHVEKCQHAMVHQRCRAGEPDLDVALGLA